MGNRILLVDDELAWLRTIGTFLKLAGYRVITAADAQQAVAQAGAEDPGVIILDVNLGGENVSRLLSFVKTNHPQARVILYTGLERDDQRVLQLLQQGAAECLRKGNLKDLLGRVQEASRLSGLVQSDCRPVPPGGWQMV